MGVSSKPTSRKHFRSITLPCRSHPSTDRIQKQSITLPFRSITLPCRSHLNKVKTWESISSLSNPSAEIVCSGLSQLAELYECLDDLFKKSLSKNRSTSGNKISMKWMDELLDVSVKFLDICSMANDVVSQTKEHVRDIGCDLRRKGGSSIENNIAKYVVFRNKLRKRIKGSPASLKLMDNICFFIEDDSENQYLTSVIRAFREVKAFSSVIFRLLLVFLAMPVLKRRPASRWRVVSRFLSNGKVVPEDQKDNDSNVNDLQSVDGALFRYCTSDKQEFVQIVKRKIEALEATLQGINSNLDLVSKHLIATRGSLLNMISFY